MTYDLLAKIGETLKPDLVKAIQSSKDKKISDIIGPKGAIGSEINLLAAASKTLSHIEPSKSPNRFESVSKDLQALTTLFGEISEDAVKLDLHLTQEIKIEYQQLITAFNRAKNKLGQADINETSQQQFLIKSQALKSQIAEFSTKLITYGDTKTKLNDLSKTLRVVERRIKAQEGPASYDVTGQTGQKISQLASRIDSCKQDIHSLHDANKASVSATQDTGRDTDARMQEIDLFLKSLKGETSKLEQQVKNIQKNYQLNALEAHLSAQSSPLRAGSATLLSFQLDLPNQRAFCDCAQDMDKSTFDLQMNTAGSELRVQIGKLRDEQYSFAPRDLLAQLKFSKSGASGKQDAQHIRVKKLEGEAVGGDPVHFTVYMDSADLALVDLVNGGDTSLSRKVNISHSADREQLINILAPNVKRNNRNTGHVTAEMFGKINSNNPKAFRDGGFSLPGKPKPGGLSNAQVRTQLEAILTRAVAQLTTDIDALMETITKERGLPR